jgi:hypothetical protein
MTSTKRNAAAQTRGVPETDQLGGTVDREHSLVPRPVQGQRGRDRARLRVTASIACRGRRKVFVCQDRPARRDDVMASYGDATNIRPLAFAATIKDMKGLLHNG